MDAAQELFDDFSLNYPTSFLAMSIFILVSVYVHCFSRLAVQAGVLIPFRNV